MQLPSLYGWAGLFLFAVGVYGGSYLPITRHLTLGPWVPLDWFFLSLLLCGGILMLVDAEVHPASSPPSPDPESDIAPSSRDQILRNIWRGLSWGALAAMAYWAIAR
ncbi:MAG: hypothetical protein VKN33_02960 [Candidatus Sericytochromatia bacterium]|nr:hypothetical protein [Candidatus Sericytochromatia bacterium]